MQGSKDQWRCLGLYIWPMSRWITASKGKKAVVTKEADWCTTLFAKGSDTENWKKNIKMKRVQKTDEENYKLCHFLVRASWDNRGTLLILATDKKKILFATWTQWKVNCSFVGRNGETNILLDPSFKKIKNLHTVCYFWKWLKVRFVSISNEILGNVSNKPTKIPSDNILHISLEVRNQVS